MTVNYSEAVQLISVTVMIIHRGCKYYILPTIISTEFELEIKIELF